MRVGLMVPCYLDVFYPEVGIATLELLEKLDVEVDYPFDQTCCGQPMANSGAESDARATGPSGSADIGGITVHPAQGVTTLTVILWPVS